MDKQQTAMLRILERDHPQIHASLLEKVVPKYTDLDQIKDIYENFKDVFDMSSSKYIMKLKFICVILHLYSPDTISCGIRCTNGLVPKLREVLGACDNPSVSNLISKALTYLAKKHFRYDVETLIKLIK